MSFDFDVFEWVRMFVWEANLLYLLEIVFRVVIVYIYTILLLRILWNSWMKDMNFLDYFIVISLWSASWDVMLYPTVPIFYALTAITAIILLKKLISILNFNSEIVNDAIQAPPARVITNWAIDYDMLDRLNIRRDTFFTMLRIEWISDTWTIEKCYVEPNWALSVFETQNSERKYSWESVFPPEEVKN